MGIVYILTNDAMPDIIKIGVTNGTIEERIKSLDNTSVPKPFRFHFAVETSKYKEIEKLMHNAFADYRVRENREFFEIAPERAVAALKISGAKEIKLSNEMIDETGGIVPEKVKTHKKRFSFSLVNIPIGTELTFTRDENKKCKVISDCAVEYEGQEYSISGLADKLLRELGYDWKAVQGPAFFEYNERTLYELKKDLENVDEEYREAER